MPAADGTEIALVIPGTTVTGTPAAAHGFEFFVSPSEDVRVPALEADHELACLRVVDQRGVDSLLSHGTAVRDLRGVDHLYVRTQFGEQLRRSQSVGHDDVGAGEQTASAHGDQIGITGATTDESNTRSGRLGRIGEHARLKTFDDGGADCCRTTVIAARQNSDAHTVVLGAGGSDGGAVLRVVGAHAEDVATLRFGDDRRIGFRLVGRGDGVPRTFEVAVGVRTLFDRDLTGSGHTFDGWSERATDDVNAGTRGDQQSESALSHSAATEPRPRVDRSG